MRTFRLRLLGGAVAIATCTAVAPEAKVDPRPDVLIILADDLGYSDLGAFGGEIRTPHLDRLAGRGMRMTDFHVSPACSPTRAMLLSGRDNHQVGLGSMAELLTPEQRGRTGYEGFLKPGVETIPERMRAAGYRTVMAGKWHLGKRAGLFPADRGFDRSFALLEGAHNHYGADQGPAYRDVGAATTYRDGDRPGHYPQGRYSSDYFADRMIGFVEETPRDRRVFAYLAFTAPHWPLQAPATDIARYRGRYDAGPIAVAQARFDRLRKIGLLPPGTRRPVDDCVWRRMPATDRAAAAGRMEVFAAMVDRMDANIGRVLAALERAGRLRNTVVIFLSDNGPEGLQFSQPINPNDPTVPIRTATDNTTGNMGAANSYLTYGPAWARAGATPFTGIKEQTTEGGIRVPAIIAGPGVVRGGVSRAATHVRDIAPTVYDLAGLASSAAAPVEPECRSYSLTPVLHGSTSKVRSEADTLCWELFYRAAVRRGSWKAVYEPNRIPLLGPITRPGEARWRLYDLSTDAAEARDRAAQEPSRLRSLVAVWHRYAATNGVVLLPEDRPKPGGTP